MKARHTAACRCRFRKGFSLIEAVLGVALIGMTAYFVAAIYASAWKTAKGIGNPLVHSKAMAGLAVMDELNASCVGMRPVSDVSQFVPTAFDETPAALDGAKSIVFRLIKEKNSVLEHSYAAVEFAENGIFIHRWKINGHGEYEHELVRKDNFQFEAVAGGAPVYEASVAGERIFGLSAYVLKLSVRTPSGARAYYEFAGGCKDG